MAYLAVVASKHARQLFPSSHPPYTVFVDTLLHPKIASARLEFKQSSRNNHSRAFPEQNGYFVLGPDGKAGSGSVDVLEKKQQRQQKEAERNNSKYLDRRKRDPEDDADHKWEEYCRVSLMLNLIGSARLNPVTAYWASPTGYETRR